MRTQGDGHCWTDDNKLRKAARHLQDRNGLPPLLVTTTLAAELVVFTETDPKLSEADLLRHPPESAEVRTLNLQKAIRESRTTITFYAYAEVLRVQFSARRERGGGHLGR
jgi:hypothetical protein